MSRKVTVRICPPRVDNMYRARWLKTGVSIAFTGCALLFAAGCASMGLSGTEGLPPQPRFLSMFVVSTRMGESGALSDAAAQEGARFSLQMLSVPPGHEAGVVERPAFGSEDPQKHFTVKSRRPLDESAFFAELASHISGRIGSNRDILL